MASAEPMGSAGTSWVEPPEALPGGDHEAFLGVPEAVSIWTACLLLRRHWSMTWEATKDAVCLLFIREDTGNNGKPKKNSDYIKCNTPETASFPLQWKCVYQSLPIYYFWWKHNLATELATILYSFYHQHPSYFLHSFSFFLECVVRRKMMFSQSALKNVLSPGCYSSKKCLLYFVWWYGSEIK